MFIREKRSIPKLPSGKWAEGVDDLVTPMSFYLNKCSLVTLRCVYVILRRSVFFQQFRNCRHKYWILEENISASLVCYRIIRMESMDQTFAWQCCSKYPIWKLLTLTTCKETFSTTALRKIFSIYFYERQKSYEALTIRNFLFIISLL